jgi:chromosome segregation ATPase
VSLISIQPGTLRGVESEFSKEKGQIRMDEEEKIKKLEAENCRLLEVAKLTREGVSELERQNREFKTTTDASRAKIKILEQKCAEQESKIADLEKIQGEGKKALFENEKIRINRDIEAKAAGEVRLLEKIQGLEARYAQKEAAIKEYEEALAQQAEKHRLAIEEREATAAQQTEKHHLALKAGEAAMAQQAAKYRLALKAYEAAVAQQDEKYRLAIRANEEVMIQQAEKHHLALKEHEARQRMAEEVKRNLEKEKKTLANELSGKIAEETRLRASLQEAGGTLEKLNARVLELKEELQNTNKHFKVLQSEKETLEGERQVALKSDAEKTASLAALGEIRERLEGEKKRLEDEKRSFGKELEAKAADEVRLLGKIQGLEARYAQKEAEIQANGEVLAQQAEKHRLALKASEAVMAQQAEKHHLAFKEHEARQRMAEEVKRNLEKEKKTLANELAGKIAEETRLRASLQEAGETLEELNARVLEQKEELQNTNKHFKALQSEKDALEGEKQAALKSDAEKTASLAALGEAKERLEGEKKRLEDEKRSFGKEFEAKAAEQVRLLEKIQGLEARYAQKEAAIKEYEETLAQQAEKHHLALKAGEAAMAQQAEKYRLALKASAVQQDEKYRLAIRANEEVMIQQAEKHHLALKEHEARQRMAEEVKRNLEKEKKALANELAGKVAEEARLRTNLQETGGTLEQMNARVLELKQELQNANKHSEGIQAEKKSFEEERKRLEKIMSDRSVQADAQLERLTKRCAEFDDVIDQIKNERDEKARIAEDLTKTVEKMEALLRERETERTALAEALKQEKEMRVKVQGHAKHVEEAFLDLEKKINAIL